jgi:hypothetical protein
MKRTPPKVELINQLLIRHAKLFQIRERCQQSFHIGVCPHLVIPYGGKQSAIHSGLLHLFIWWRYLIQNFLVDERPVRIVGRFITLVTPPHQVAGIYQKAGTSTFDVSYYLAGDPLAAFQPALGCTASLFLFS